MESLDNKEILVLKRTSCILTIVTCFSIVTFATLVVVLSKDKICFIPFIDIVCYHFLGLKIASFLLSIPTIIYILFCFNLLAFVIIKELVISNKFTTFAINFIVTALTIWWLISYAYICLSPLLGMGILPVKK